MDPMQACGAEEASRRESVKFHVKQMLTIPRENSILINGFMVKLSLFLSFQFSVDINLDVGSWRIFSLHLHRMINSNNGIPVPR